MTQENTVDPNDIDSNVEGEKLSISLTPSLKKSLDDLLIEEKKLADTMDQIKMQKDAIKEAYKAVAEKLGIKPAELKEITNLIHKSDEEPKILPKKKNSITFVESYMENGGLPEKAKKTPSAAAE